jgi:Ca2+/Na+ antiporter
MDIRFGHTRAFMLSSLGLIAIGVLLLVVGGEVLLRGAVDLATLLRLTAAVIGLTVVAAGTSVPELAVSGVAAYGGKPDIAVANVIGSNIFNITLILGLCTLVRPGNERAIFHFWLIICCATRAGNSASRCIRSQPTP